MERMLVSPSGVVVRLGAGMQLDVATTMLLSVHFSCVTMATAASGADHNFCFSTPFSSILHESRWERESEVQRMMIHVAGNLINPDDLHFLTHAFCDYSWDALESFNFQGGGGGGLLSISVLLQIPYATATAVGPYDPPPRPHLPHAVVESQPRLHLPDIAIDPHYLLAQAYHPDATAAAGPYDPMPRPHIPDAVVGQSDDQSRPQLHPPDIVAVLYNLLARVYLPNTTIGRGPYNPPLPPHLPHAVVGPSDEPSRSRPHLPDDLLGQAYLADAAVTIAIGSPYNPPSRPHDEPSRPRPHLPDIAVDPHDHLMQVHFPEVPLDWDGGDAAADSGNNPALASTVQQIERVVFGANDDDCRETSCVICIDDFEATSVLSVMPCRHSFHSACLDEWLRRSNSCPLCRFSLPAAN